MLKRNTEHIRFRSVEDFNDFPYSYLYEYVAGDYGGYEPYYLPEGWMPDEKDPAIIIPPNPEEKAGSDTWQEFGLWMLMCWSLGLALVFIALAGFIGILRGLMP